MNYSMNELLNVITIIAGPFAVVSIILFAMIIKQKPEKITSNGSVYSDEVNRLLEIED